MLMISVYSSMISNYMKNSILDLKKYCIFQFQSVPLLITQFHHHINSSILAKAIYTPENERMSPEKGPF